MLLDDGLPDDPFVVFTTSGTTSRPKLVRHTQASIARHGRNAARSFGYTESDTASEAAAFRIVDGELQLQGPSMFEGYLAEGGDRIDTDLTGRAFADGWFRTGDAADRDDDRTFTYLSRLGDAIRLDAFPTTPSANGDKIQLGRLRTAAADLLNTPPNESELRP